MKYNIELDVYTDLIEEGIETLIFSGENIDPLVTHRQTFSELLQDYLKCISYTCGDSTYYDLELLTELHRSLQGLSEDVLKIIVKQQEQNKDAL